jgi:hypothetical protein
VRDVAFQTDAFALGGEAWIQNRGDNYWILVGLMDNRVSHLFPTFEQMAQSWRPDLSAIAPAPAVDAQQAFSDASTYVVGFAVSLALVLLVGLPLLVFGSRRSATLGVVGILVVISGLLAGLSILPDNVALTGQASSYVPRLGDWSLELAAVVVTLGLLPGLLARQRRGERVAERLRVLLVLNLALLGVEVYYSLFAPATGSTGAPDGPGRWAGLLLIGAFLWDLLTENGLSPPHAAGCHPVR